jgi:hypothetical protein
MSREIKTAVKGMINRLCSTILSWKRKIICALPDRHKALQELGRDGGTVE